MKPPDLDVTGLALGVNGLKLVAPASFPTDRALGGTAALVAFLLS